MWIVKQVEGFMTQWQLFMLLRKEPLKTLLEKDEMLVTKIFSILLCFLPDKDKFYLLKKLWIRFADYKINVIWQVKFAFGKVENVVGKGENAGYQHFLLFQQFSKGYFLRVVKSCDYVGN